MSKTLVTSLVLGFLLLISCRPSKAPVVAQRGSGPMPQAAYIWQRSWNEEVSKAVELTGQQFPSRGLGLVPLAAQVSWGKGGESSVVWPALDWVSLAASKQPISLALRIDPWPGGLPNHVVERETLELVKVAQKLASEAKINGLVLQELQLDFDAASSKLPLYQKWVEAVAKALNPLPIVFTALPDWLNSPHFLALARSSAGFVLQVHAAERPEFSAEKPRLVDPSKARRWVELAGKFGVAFSVALPTYRSQAAYKATGQFLGIVSEGPARQLPPDAVVKEYESDPAEIAALVAGWEKDRPALLARIMWYRLPVAGDVRNWRWPTFRAVIAGRAPLVKWRLSSEGINPVDIFWLNEGEADASPPNLVKATVAGVPIVAGDGTNGFRFQMEAGARVANFSRDAQPLAPPGARVAIGWLRLAQPTSEVKMEFSNVVERMHNHGK